MWEREMRERRLRGVRMRIMMMRRWKGRPQEKRAGYKRV